MLALSSWATSSSGNRRDKEDDALKTVLIIVTLAEVALLVVVLAVYLLIIARTLRNVSQTLGLITFGVRAIEKQTEPIGPVVGDVNAALEQVAGALEQVVGRPSPAGEEHEAVGGTQEAAVSHAPVELDTEEGGHPHRGADAG
jgi:hypothetical protein